MPQALQVINAFKQNLAGAVFEALAPGTGDSFQVQNVPLESAPYLAEVWGTDDDSAFELSVYGSRWHDQTLGLRMAGPAASSYGPVERATLLSPCGADQRLYSSDTLHFNVKATAADNFNATAIIYYPDLPGIAARLATWAQVKSMTKNLVGINVPLVAGVGDYGASVALNSADDRLHADTDYAVLGFTSNIPCPLVAISGIDTGNMRMGGPVLADADHDSTLFVDLAENYNAALIPIINANNRGSIFLQAAGLTAITPNIDVMLAELSSKFSG